MFAQHAILQSFLHAVLSVFISQLSLQVAEQSCMFLEVSEAVYKSPPAIPLTKEIKSFLRTNMYNNKSVLRKNQRGKVIIKKLFNVIKSKPTKFLSKDQLTKDKFRAISDFISGMTDRYAINLYNNFK